MPNEAKKPLGQRDLVYIVDDDQASREAVEALVTEMGVETLAFASAEEFLEKYDGRRPACLVTDVRMLHMSGLELQEELISRGHNLATVVLTAYAETPITVRAVKNGAVTLLEKPCRDLELWDAVRTGLSLDRSNLEQDRRNLAITKKLASLTPTEQQVLERVVAGDPNKAIANKLDVSVRTIESRRQAIFTKMEAGSLAELVRLVTEAKQAR